VNVLRRYERIMEALLAQKEVTVNELSEKLQVTGKTIREDFAKLEEKGLLVRIHGGAVLAQSDQLGILSATEPNVKHGAEKREIAAVAVRYIEENDIVALDAGSTTLEIARKLENKPLTLITNDLNIIGELTRKEQIRLVVPGGTRLRNMLVGPEAVAYIRSLNIRKSFVSATAVHLDSGFSLYSSDLLAYKQALLETAHTVYAVADHHKFGQSALRTFATLSDIKVVITDSGLPDETAEQFRQAGVTIVNR